MENENEINEFIENYCNSHSNFNLRSKCEPHLFELVYSIFILFRMNSKKKLEYFENIWKSFKSQKPLALKQIFEEFKMEIKIKDFKEMVKSDLIEILNATLKIKNFIRIKDNLFFFFKVWFLIREKIPNEIKNLKYYKIDKKNLKNPYFIDYLQEISFMCNTNFFFLFVKFGVIKEKLKIGNDNKYNFIIIKKKDCLILFEFSENSKLSTIISNNCIICDEDCIENSYKLINCNHIICEDCFSKLKKKGDIECEKCINYNKFDHSVSNKKIKKNEDIEFNEYSKCKKCSIDYLKIHLLNNKCRSCFIHKN